MRTFLCISLTSLFILVSCAPQPTPDIKATETAIAHSVLATLTAQAPMPTPSPVPTHAPTATSEPTDTPIPAPTPLPHPSAGAMAAYWAKVKPLMQQFEDILARELPQVERAVELGDPSLLCQIPLEDVIDIIHKWPYDYEGPPEAKDFDLHFYWAIEDWEMVQDCIQLYCQTGKAQYLQELATHLNNCGENLDRASELLIELGGK